jgi:hypothetical protein
MGANIRRPALTVDTTKFVTHVLAVIFSVTLPAAVDTGPICALELIRAAGGHGCKGQKALTLARKGSQRNRNAALLKVLVIHSQLCVKK